MAGINFGVQIVATLMVIVALFRSGNGQSISSSIPPTNSPIDSVGNRTKNFTPMHMVLMTQRGYIQFLRWELPVPEIKEFTFCLWVKSTNLTYPHSIFSYSKNEKDRLVRSWISSYGKSLHLEINNVEIFAIATSMEEQRWYHVCESWDNADGRYAVWIDGQKLIDDYATKMSGHVIPSKGDIVLGQEYTDFDKGLEDGIEGAVLGFNLVLGSAFEKTLPRFDRNGLDDSGFDGQSNFGTYDIGSTTGEMYGNRNDRRSVTDQSPLDGITPLEIGRSRTRSQNRRSGISRTSRIRSDPRGITRNKRKSFFFGDRRFVGSIGSEIGEKPIGRRLVETSFVNCREGRGSPRIGDALMIISWTRTPVRVFGGAVVKNSGNECGRF